MQNAGGKLSAGALFFPMRESSSEIFSRLDLLVGGTQPRQRLAEATLMVCGLGGVGSWAAEALARCGARRLILADCDAVSESNINRQAFALHSTIGLPKCQAAAQRLKDISPELECICVRERLAPENIPELLERHRPDGVLDAIDDRSAKLSLLAECVTRGTAIVSSMGAAHKTRPEHIRVADISETSGCPFTQLMRKALRRRGIDSGIRCVFSDEPPVLTAGTASEEPGQKRPMGSMITVTAIFGMMAADALMEPFLKTRALPHRGGWKG